jgi:hypothetical protein
MAQEPRLEHERVTPRRFVEKDAAPDGCWIHASVCQGMAPMIVGSPSRFFGVQLIAGLASMLILVLAEVLR